MFYPGSAPHGGGKSLHPASLILMMMITVARVLYLESYCLNLTRPTCGTCESFAPFGEPCPSLYMLKGRFTSNPPGHYDSLVIRHAGQTVDKAQDPEDRFTFNGGPV